MIYRTNEQVYELGYKIVENALNVLQGQGKVVGWLAAVHIFTPTVKQAHEDLWDASRTGILRVLSGTSDGKPAWYFLKENEEITFDKTQQIHPTRLLPRSVLKKLSLGTQMRHDIPYIFDPDKKRPNIGLKN